MKLSEVKTTLQDMEALDFELPNGTFVPKHFHVTEVGVLTKDFIDCGGTVRHEKAVSFQLWEAGDYDHRLAPQKLISIIELAQNVLGIGDWEVEVEYQAETIGKYALEFKDNHFRLSPKTTACLASDSCGVADQKPKIKLSQINASEGSCTPGGGCC